MVPSRRAVLGTALWSVPAVTVASAAPAFAASFSLDVDLGTVSVFEDPEYPGGGYYLVSLHGAQVTIHGVPTAGDALRIEVGWTYTGPRPPDSGDVIRVFWWSESMWPRTLIEPDVWHEAAAGVVYHYAGPLVESQIGLPNATYFGNAWAPATGYFTLVFTAGGATVIKQIDVPGAGAPAIRVAPGLQAGVSKADRAEG